MSGVIAGTRARLVRYFVTGLFAILPLAITIAIVIWVAHFLNRLMGPGTLIGGYLQSLGARIAPDSSITYILGFVLVLAAILLLGVVLESGAKRWMRAMVDNTIQRIPILSTIYRTTVQMMSMLRAGDDERLKGMSVVSCRFGGEDGTWVLALAPSSDCITMQGGPYRAVLIPTAPVPFGGALLFLPEDAVVPAGVTLDEFISVYMSMGVTMPPTLPAPGDRHTDQPAGTGPDLR